MLSIPTHLLHPLPRSHHAFSCRGCTGRKRAFPFGQVGPSGIERLEDVFATPTREAQRRPKEDISRERGSEIDGLLVEDQVVQCDLHVTRVRSNLNMRWPCSTIQNRPRRSQTRPGFLQWLGTSVPVQKNMRQSCAVQCFLLFSTQFRLNVGVLVR